MPFERDFIPEYSPIPIIVYDFQVIAHSIYAYVESIEYITKGNGVHFTSLVKAIWAYKLNYGIDMLENSLDSFTALIVNDSKGKVEGVTNNKGYWRHKVAYDLGLSEYKQGRSVKTDTFNLICSIGLTYINQPNSTFFYLEEEYMEADDIAGELARIKRNSSEDSIASKRQMLLFTHDGDWQGLVSDYHKIIWCNTGPWLPRMRNNYEVCDYYYRKMGVKIEKAKECYDVKALYGDKGDGLLPGSPHRLYDLYNADFEYKLSEKSIEYLTQVMNNNFNSKKIEHIQNSSQYLGRFGIIPPITGSSSDADVVNYNERAEVERYDAIFKDTSIPIKKICKQLVEEEIEKCLKIGKQDEIVRKTLKEVEQKLEECPKEDLPCKKPLKKTITNHKLLRAKLKVEAASLGKPK